MKILVLSLDQGLLIPAKSDTEIRFTDYLRFIESIDVLIPGFSWQRREVNSNFYVNGISGRFLPVKVLNLIITGAKIAREKKIDLIIANEPTIGLVGWIIKKIFGGKLNVNVFGLEIADKKWMSSNIIRNKLIRSLQIFVLKHADSIRSDSKSAVYDLIKLGINREKMEFIPSIPSRSAIERLKKIKKNEPTNPVTHVTLLAVGFLIPQKGYEILFRALSQVVIKHPRCKLIIIGDGPEKASLMKFARDLGITTNVRFMGNIDYKDLPKFYKQADIFVLSSHFEGGPRVVMEAAFCQLPIVSTNVGSVADMLTDGQSAYIIRQGDSSQLAEKIIQLIRYPNLRRAFGKSARKQIEQYCDYEQNTKQLVRHWKKASSRSL